MKVLQAKCEGLDIVACFTVCGGSAFRLPHSRLFRAGKENTSPSAFG